GKILRHERAPDLERDHACRGDGHRPNDRREAGNSSGQRGPAAGRTKEFRWGQSPTRRRRRITTASSSRTSAATRKTGRPTPAPPELDAPVRMGCRSAETGLCPLTTGAVTLVADAAWRPVAPAPLPFPPPAAPDDPLGAPVALPEPAAPPGLLAAPLAVPAVGLLA